MDDLFGRKWHPHNLNKKPGGWRIVEYIHVFAYGGLINKMPPILQVTKSDQKLIIPDQYFGVPKPRECLCDWVAKIDFSKTQGLNIEIQQ